MTPTPRILTIAACLGALVLASPAVAQAPVQAPPDDSNVSFDSAFVVKKKTKDGLPEVKAQPLVWPRLDAGAVLCRSEDDLNRLAARRTGQTVNGSIDCKIIRLATPIRIVDRKGPGHTEVATTDPAAGGPGWTDAWLPTKAPTAIATTVRR
ncbi:MAG TPA: hypothetical protein DDZ81_04320 [Acetobacteraceae bacterium]|jgi:hypothetical protein|nr:hypothetical protein [Acetobacteraceae bacterium]